MNEKINKKDNIFNTLYIYRYKSKLILNLMKT